MGSIHRHKFITFDNRGTGMTDTHPIEIQVQCYSGYRGEQTPRSILISGKQIDVVSILDMWLAPDHRYFKFNGSDGGVYIIRYDTEKHLWELTFFKDQ